MMPYPDSEYPSILRGRDKRESQRLLAAAPELLRLLREGSSVVSSLEADCDEAGIDSQRARWWWQSVDKLFDKLEVE
jgi:hypothetical protein